MGEKLYVKILLKPHRMSSLSKRITPLVNRVLVQKVIPPKTTSGGIMIPDSASKNDLNEGTVKAIGRGKFNKSGTNDPILVKVGDRVLLPEYGGMTLKQGDEEYVLLRDEELLAILDN